MKKTNQGKANFLALQETRLRLIEDCFNQSVYQLASKESQSETECPPEQPREWPKLSLLQSIKQPLTQDQMRRACESIRNNAVSDLDAIPKHKYTVIDFAKGSQNWDEQIFTLNRMVLNIEVLGGGGAESFDFTNGDRLDATVYVCYEDRTAQAFLKAKVSDKDYYFELAYFSMLYLLDEDGQESECNDNVGSKDNPSKDEKVNREVGMFTFFSKINNLLFVTTY